MQMEQKHHDAKPSAYLWGRCEGWVRIGVFHAVIIDFTRGVCVDEAGEVLMSWVDGSWRPDLPEFEGWVFDQVAVTHLPIDPHRMSNPDWAHKWKLREEKRQRLGLERNADKKRGTPKDGDLPGMPP
jgi:hypothetical protein